MKWMAPLLMLTLVSCVPRGPHRPLLGEGEKVGYDSVKPLFAKYCSSCHPSRSGPDWLDYQQAEAVGLSGKLVQRVLIEKSMPPPATPESAAIEEKDRRMIAQWVRSGMPITATGAPMPTPDLAEAAVQSCFQCHGSSGPGSEPKAARLAGQNEDYLVQQLTLFKWRERIDPTGKMNDVARSLSVETIRSISRYFAAKVSPSSAPGLTPDKRILYERGRELAAMACNVCHMSDNHNGRPPSPWLPVLRNQSKIYLLDQILYFRSQERVSPLMYQFVKDLTHRDIEAVALYYSVGGD